MSASTAQSSIEFGTGMPLWSFLFGGLLFAAVGAILSLAACLVLRAALPKLTRKGFIAIAIAAIPLLEMLVIALLRLAVEGVFSLSFLTTIRSEGWALLLVGLAAGLIVARRMAPAPVRKIDPSIFD